MSHLEIPATSWPRGKVYRYCPACHEVLGMDTYATPVCPSCRASPLRDIFAEMASRISKVWTFFEKTRWREGKWYFKFDPGDSDYLLGMSSRALGTYGELRCLGFHPPEEPPWGNDDEVIDTWIDTVTQHLDPDTGFLLVKPGDGTIGGAVASPERYVASGFEWTLRNRVFMAHRFAPPPGTATNEDYIETPEKARTWLEKTWAEQDPWCAGSWTSGAVFNHLQILESRGEDPEDESIAAVHQWLTERQDPDTGAWYSGKEFAHNIVVNGIFKLFVTYERLGWPIPRQEIIIDYVLSGSHKRHGFGGQGCSVFDPMQVLYVLRRRGCLHRSEETDDATAASFLTFLENWDDEASWFKEGDWDGKHNLGIPLYMACLLLDHPYMRINTIYNWREGPIIKRLPDGTLKVRENLTYSTPGFAFTG